MRENAEAPLTWNNIKDRLHAKYLDRSLLQDYTLQMADIFVQMKLSQNILMTKLD